MGNKVVRLLTMRRVVCLILKAFVDVVRSFFVETRDKTLAHLDGLLAGATEQLPYPLLPVSQGFLLSLKRQRDRFARSVKAIE